MTKPILYAVLFSYACVAFGQSASKEAKKQYKSLQKEGWEVLPGDDPLLDQLTLSLQKIGELEKGTLVSEGSATTSRFEAAMKGSRILAQRNLASLFASSVSSYTKSEKGADLEKFLSQSVVKVTASLRSETIMTIYREVDGKYEFKTMVSCKTKDFWNLLPASDKETLKTQFGVTDEAF